MPKKESSIKEEILFHLRAINELRNDLSDGDDVTPDDAAIWDNIIMEKDVVLDLVKALAKEQGKNYDYDFLLNNFDAFMKTIFTKKELASVKVGE